MESSPGEMSWPTAGRAVHPDAITKIVTVTECSLENLIVIRTSENRSIREDVATQSLSVDRTIPALQRFA
jgi:hypothetical protein